MLLDCHAYASSSAAASSSSSSTSSSSSSSSLSEAGAAAAAGSSGGGEEKSKAEEEEPPPDAALLMSDLLHDDGGYALDQGVCQDHRPYQRVAATMELVEPCHTATKDEVLAYLASTRRVCSQRLFDLRQPEHLEVTKYGGTVLFLRQLLGLCGYEVSQSASQEVG